MKKRRCLLCGTSRMSLMAALIAASPGIALGGAATVTVIQQSTYTINPANTPITFGGGTFIYTLVTKNTPGASGGDAVDGGGGLTVSNAGVLQGSATGIALGSVSSPGTIVNSGYISGNHGYGILLAHGGSLVNSSVGGSLSNGKYAGFIEGATNGVQIIGSGTVTNAGAIYGAVSAIYAKGGTLSLTNSGMLNGGNYGVTILDANAAITNSGTIIGGVYSVRFLGTGTHILTLTTGSLLCGPVFAGPSSTGSGTNELVLEGSGSAGNSFIGFDTLTVEAGPGAGWTLSGTSTIGATEVKSGALIVTGALMSAFTIDPGARLQGNSVSLEAQGTVTDNGTLVFDQGMKGSFATPITGTGAVVKLNGGTLTLSGDNGFTGGVMVEAGTLILGSATAFGSGGLTVDGGIADLTGFSITRTSLAGAGGTVLLGPQTLTLEQASDTSFAGTISGSGLIKAGIGRLTLNGGSTLGTTMITGGTVEVGDAAHPGASLASAVAVEAGGTLSGHGTIIGDVTNNGVVAPARLQLQGNFSQGPAGTLAIEANANGAHSLLAVSGATSLAGTLAVETDPGIFVRGASVTFLTSGSGVNGSFATLMAPGGVRVEVDSAVVSISGFVGNAGTSGNERAVGAALAATTGGGDLGVLIAGVNSVTPAAQNPALDQVGGEVYADFSNIEREMMRGFLTGLQTQLTDAPPNASLSSWGRASGNFGSVDGNGNAHGFSSTASGGILGLEQGVGYGTTLGAALSYGHTDFSLNGLGQSGALDSVAAGLYGEERLGPLFVDAAAGLGLDYGTARRSIGFAGLGRSASGSVDGLTGGVLASGGFRILWPDRLLLEPSVSLAYTHVSTGAVSESGANGGDLGVASQSQESLAGILGARLEQGFALESGKLRAGLSVAWSHDFLSLAPHVNESFIAAPGSGFTLTGADPGSDAALLGVGVAYDVSMQLSIYGRYDATIGTHETDHAVTAGVKFTW
ncbi:MAG TPA: autotransporter domain-containing protein [Stellaceae bacterium]|nr:autotransporter domain-containing protein [Stellaceae bacterium]